MSNFRLTPPLPADDKPLSAPGSAMELAAAAALAESLAAGQRPPKPVRLNLDIDHVRHRKLKLYAVENGLSISEVIRRLIDTVIRASN